MGLVRLAGTVAVAVAACAFASGCASSGASPRPFPGARVPPADPTIEPAPAPAPPSELAGSSAALGAAVAETALRFRGVPYRNGGNGPDGFDCSGLVQYVFAQHGVSMPRGVREQLQIGHDIRLAGIQKGDLIFFAIGSNGPSHVGVAIGGDEFVHAPSSRGVVRIEKFSSPYWARRIVGVRRVTP